MEIPSKIFWTGNEEKAFREGMEKFKCSSTPYIDILRDQDYRILRNRSNVDLKDKARILGIKVMVRISADDDVNGLREIHQQVMAAKINEGNKKKRREIIERRITSADIRGWTFRLRWTNTEELALIEGYNKYSSEGCKLPWAMILKDPDYSVILQNRNNKHWKDKMINIKRKNAELIRLKELRKNRVDNGH